MITNVFGKETDFSNLAHPLSRSFTLRVFIVKKQNKCFVVKTHPFFDPYACTVINNRDGSQVGNGRRKIRENFVLSKSGKSPLCGLSKIRMLYLLMELDRSPETYSRAHLRSFLFFESFFFIYFLISSIYLLSVFVRKQYVPGINEPT